MDGSIIPLAKDHGVIMLRRKDGQLRPHMDIEAPDYPYPYITGTVINHDVDTLVAEGALRVLAHHGGAQDGSWVPNQVVKFGGLREVVVVKRHHGKMLPVEWEERTVRIWREEVGKMQWPEGWEGRIPELKLVEPLDDLNMGYGYPAAPPAPTWKMPNLPLRAMKTFYKLVTWS